MEFTVTVNSVEEMRLLVDLLRNESPIMYDIAAGIVRTGSWETVGEGEK